ncbi:MAG: hypothetical protein K8S23_13345 [Candidatus Cloacimonetes bacterium]|nr:hypothetical protein [Candidatus Cloacimonadota bacterium]
MKYSVKEFDAHLLKKYPSYLKSFENLSRDDDKNSVTNSQIQAFDFDKITSNKFKSADALFFCNIDDSIYFIEFKNKPEKNIKSKDIRLKAIESVIALGVLLEKENLIQKRNEIFCNFQMYLMIVFSLEKNEQDKNIIDIELRKRLENSESFNLERYEGIIFKKTYTVPNNIFEKQLEKCFIFGNWEF